MKILYSLPKDEQFFGAYASLIPSLKKLGYLAQVVTGLTELAILYHLIKGHLSDYLPAIAAPGAIIGAIVGTAFLEIGLRKFFPFGVRAILYKRFQGLHLVLSIAIWVVALVLAIFSGVIHFQGSKDLVQRYSPPPRQESTAKTDSMATTKTATAQQAWKVDSAAAASRYAPMIEATKAKYAALKAKEDLALKALEAKERREGRSYSSLKAQIKGRLADTEAIHAQELATLEDRKAQALEAATTERNRALSSISNERQKAANKVEQGNAKALNEATRKVRTYGGGLAWFTVICIGVFAFSVVIDEVHRKGSGVEEVPQPNQYVFSDTITGEFWAMLNDKINYLSRTWIKKQAERTPEPPAPEEPPTLWEIAQQGLKRKKAIQQGKPDEQHIPPFSQNALNQYETFFDGSGSSTDAMENRRPIGFKTPLMQSVSNALHYEAPEVLTEVVEVDKSKKPCQHCETLFRPKTTWQKFCTTDCREAFHEAKHGQPFKPGEYHKGRQNSKSQKGN